MAGVKVFTRMDVYNRYLGGTYLMWELHHDFIRSVAEPTSFVIKASRSGVGDWLEIGQVDDGYFYFVDPNRWIWAKDLRIHYVVEVVTGDGNIYQSPVVQALGPLPQQSKLIARRIIQKEAMVLEKKNGTLGLFYKRRHWGTRCPECTDYDTNEPTANRCSTCYDTGFVGGYFDPVETWMHLKAASGRRMKVQEPTQTTENRSKHGRMLACPWPDTNDVWVNCMNDQHFVVQKVTPVEFRGVPILFDPVDLRLAPSGDIVYTLPRAGEASSSSQ